MIVRQAHHHAALVALIALALTACSSTDKPAPPLASAPASTTQTASAAAEPAASSKACKLFTQGEIADALGTSVGKGTNWGSGFPGCEWSAGGDNAVQAALMPDRSYWENLAETTGGEALSGLGQEAFIAPWMGSFRAGALTPQGAVYVMSPKRDVSVTLLRTAVARMPTL